MPQTPAPRPDKRRKSLLILEFSSLAVLLVSMGWFSNLSSAGNPVHPAWLLVPAAERARWAQLWLRWRWIFRFV